MLGLKLPTDPRWVNIAEKDLGEILTDHAWCEQKAASSAISLMVGFPEKAKMVETLAEIAQEELAHFRSVLSHLYKRGWVLGKQRKDEYVLTIIEFFDKNVPKEERLVNQLLYAALIEARSCERFKLLSEKISDPELTQFYKELMISEANHYKVFLAFARDTLSKEQVDQKWKNLLEYEALIISNLGTKATMHG